MGSDDVNQVDGLQLATPESLLLVSSQVEVLPFSNEFKCQDKDKL